MTLELQGHFPHSQQKAGRRDARWWQEGNSRTVPDSSALTSRVGDSGRQRSLEKSVDDGPAADKHHSDGEMRVGEQSEARK